MFSKMLIYLFVVVGVFAVLFASIPGDFFEAAFSSSMGVDKEIAERFDVANVTVYGNTGGGNMTYQWSSYHDHSDAPQHQAGLPSGQYLEVWWADDPSWVAKSLQFRHTTEQWWGLAFHRMVIYYADGTLIPFSNYIYAEYLETAWDDDANASVFLTRTPVASSYLIQYNQSKYSSITNAWDGGELNYFLSYEIDWNVTSINAFSLLGQLLTFQNPDLGITGPGGAMLNMLIAIPFWAMTVILIIKLIQSVIPLIGGIDE